MNFDQFILYFVISISISLFFDSFEKLYYLNLQSKNLEGYFDISLFFAPKVDFMIVIQNFSIKNVKYLIDFGSLSPATFRCRFRVIIMISYCLN